MPNDGAGGDPPNRQGRGQSGRNAMSPAEHTQPRHLAEPDQLGRGPRRRWVSPVAAVVGVFVLLLIPVVFVLAATRTTPGRGTRSAAAGQPAATSAARHSLLGTGWGVALVAAQRMTS